MNNDMKLPASISDEIISYIESLGIDPAGAKLYKTLAAKGPQTLLQISRETRIERTKLYRSIEHWVHQGIIEEELSHKTKLYRASPIERMRLLVMQKKASIDALAGSFAAFSDQVMSLREEVVTTKVLQYHGRDGARQMLWNQIRTTDELLSYTSRSWQDAVGSTFFNNWAGEFRKMHIKNRELRHPNFLSTVDTSALRYPDLGSLYQWRAMAPKHLEITHSMELYNDVVAISYWNGDDIFGVELYNSHIATMQKSIFNHYWQIAKHP